MLPGCPSFPGVTPKGLRQSGRRDRGPTRAVGSMNQNLPESLPEPSVPELQASLSVEENAVLGLCSQHHDVPKDSWGLVSSCPLPFGFCPLLLHFRLIASVPCASPWLLRIYSCLFFSFADDLGLHYSAIFGPHCGTEASSLQCLSLGYSL